MKKKSIDIVETGMASSAVQDLMQMNPGQALALIQQGSVYAQGKRLKNDCELAPGSRITVVVEERGQSTASPLRDRVELDVLHEDHQLIVVNKPAGMVTQPTEGASELSLLEVIQKKLRKDIFVVHRLDRETSGVICFAKNKLMASDLAQGFKERQTSKTYFAICGSKMFDSGKIDLPLSRDPTRPQRWRATREANGIDALTHFERLAFDDISSLIELTPHTGRTHQLRAHLAAFGFPIFGDTLYGGTGADRCLLHAFRLTVLGQTFVAPVPLDMKEHLVRLKFDC
jgi:23S rRNA pseudouridine1911/1915/1917 synthase